MTMKKILTLPQLKAIAEALGAKLAGPWDEYDEAHNPRENYERAMGWVQEQIEKSEVKAKR